jgi:hypothetical protein
MPLPAGSGRAVGFRRVEPDQSHIRLLTPLTAPVLLDHANATASTTMSASAGPDPFCRSMLKHPLTNTAVLTDVCLPRSSGARSDLSRLAFARVSTSYRVSLINPLRLSRRVHRISKRFTSSFYLRALDLQTFGDAPRESSKISLAN